MEVEEQGAPAAGATANASLRRKDAGAAEPSSGRKRLARDTSLASSTAASPGDEQESSDDAMDDDEDDAEEEEEEEAEGRARVFRPGVDTLEEGEELTCDMEAYDMLHRLRTEWPCLSFDVVKDQLGSGRRGPGPHCVTLVAGTQADEAQKNAIYLMQWSNLRKQKHREEDDEDSSSSEEEDSSDEEADDATKSKKPYFHCVSVAHSGTVNRIRAMPQAQSLVATWSEEGKVCMYNLAEEFQQLPSRLASAQVPPVVKKPVFESCPLTTHRTEGYAMAWSGHRTGMFASGDNDGKLMHWLPLEGGWTLSAFKETHRPGTSIEDVQWKKAGLSCEQLLASCGGDGTLQVCDIRVQGPILRISCVEEGSGVDVNVLDWNPLQGELIATGADDGCIKVFDLRASTRRVLERGASATCVEEVSPGEALMAEFEYHRGGITAISWHPTDEAALCAASLDGTLSLWDMAVEEDDEMSQGEAVAKTGDNNDGDEEDAAFPPQLLFLHAGQEDVREAAWHPQLPGVVLSTAGDGFHLFKARENF
ncbi:unnamed protein product [Amoebophrya sp. A25]|nr:unnamed protein product [Amoebophrya sp. A25]|eukprot:GSA25T00013528001.1